VSHLQNFREKVDQALDLIRDALRAHERVAVACSFGKDSMVAVHLCRRVAPDIPVFCISTPFKPPETVAYRERIAGAWDLNLKVFERQDDIGAGEQRLWETDPERCCDYFKVEPTREAVADLDAWICGLRRTEGSTRTDFDFVETRGGLVKINPILDFTESDIWLYHALHGIPPNPLYAEGYRSLGCAPCSRPGGETERAGRWAGTAKQGGECGIHTRTLKAAAATTTAVLTASARCLACGCKQAIPVPGAPHACEACGAKPLLLAGAFAATMTADMAPPTPQQVCAVDLGLDESRVCDNGCRVAPLLKREDLAAEAGLSDLCVKYETVQPTGTFKARSALYVMTWLAAHGVEAFVVASTGNAAASLAQAARSAGLRLHVFMPRDVTPGRVDVLRAFGATVYADAPTYDLAKQTATEFARQNGFIRDSGGMNPVRLGSMKTLAYELFAQLGGRAPDWYVQAVSGGIGPVGVLAAFEELLEAGLIETMPRLLAVQPAGCAPMVTSWAAGRRDFDIVEKPNTRVVTLGTGKPGLYPAIYDLCQKAPGSQFIAVDDDTADRYRDRLAGYNIVGENTVGCAFAGMVEAVRTGVIAPEETVVFVCSGRGMGAA